jgi:hypothetical protein
MRRMKAPITVWLRMAPCAARRNIAVARFLVLLALELSTLPPLIRLSGHYFNQEQKCFFALPAIHVQTRFADDGSHGQRGWD